MYDILLVLVLMITPFLTIRVEHNCIHTNLLQINTVAPKAALFSSPSPMNAAYNDTSTFSHYQSVNDNSGGSCRRSF